MKLKRTLEGEETRDTNGDVTSASIKYYVIDPTTKKEAMDACFEDAPDHYDDPPDIPTIIIQDGEQIVIPPETTDSLPKSGVRFDGIEPDNTYVISVMYEANSDSGNYRKKGKASTDYLSAYSFDCGGGQRHITASLEQEILDGNIDPGGVIGWNGKYGSESQIAGVDIPDANIRESYTRVIASSKVANEKRKIAQMVGCVNSTEFNGWAAGECMFLGATYSQQGSEKESQPKASESQEDYKVSLTSITYNFAIRFNEDGFTLGEKTYDREKKGFQYVWTISETKVKGGSPELEIKGAFLETVCREADFNALKIPKIILK